MFAERRRQARKSKGKDSIDKIFRTPTGSTSGRKWTSFMCKRLRVSENSSIDIKGRKVLDRLRKEPVSFSSLSLEGEIRGIHTACIDLVDDDGRRHHGGIMAISKLETAIVDTNGNEPGRYFTSLSSWIMPT